MGGKRRRANTSRTSASGASIIGDLLAAAGESTVLHPVEYTVERVRAAALYRDGDGNGHRQNVVLEPFYAGGHVAEPVHEEAVAQVGACSGRHKDRERKPTRRD